MKTDLWPLPRIEEVFDDLCCAKLFTTLTVFSGYSQVEVTDSCRETTTFTTRYGTYQFEVMPLRLLIAPSNFQRLMDVVVQSLPFVRAYNDDVAILSESVKK